jgi:pSer/pThr/pTyr-binding forkhead associated (FHA) protein
VIPGEDSDEMDQTMVIDTSQHRNMMKKSNSKAPKPLPKVNMNEIAGVLTYLAGGNGNIKLKGKITKLGKHPTSDIVVKGLFVGRTSVTISRRPDGFYLSYVSGLSKPKVNEKRVKQSAILNDFDIIDIGSTKMQFFIQKPHQKRKKMI